MRLVLQVGFSSAVNEFMIKGRMFFLFIRKSCDQFVEYENYDKKIEGGGFYINYVTRASVLASKLKLYYQAT